MSEDAMPQPEGVPMTQSVRVQNFSVSSDGYGSGEGQSHDRPFGHADPGALFFWAGATAHWPNRTEPGGTYGLDDYCTRDFTNNIGAEIMGRNKFGPQRGPWENYDWQGWWGDGDFLNAQGPEATEKRKNGGPGQWQIAVVENLSALDPVIDHLDHASQE